MLLGMKKSSVLRLLVNRIRQSSQTMIIRDKYSNSKGTQRHKARVLIPLKKTRKAGERRQATERRTAVSQSIAHKNRRACKRSSVSQKTVRKSETHDCFAHDKNYTLCTKHTLYCIRQ